MKRNVVLVLLVLSMCILVACGEQKNDAANEEDVVKEENDAENTDIEFDETVVEGDIRPELKKEIDDYETYFFEYVDCLIEFRATDDKEAMMEEYQKLSEPYPQAMTDYMAIIKRDLTEDELAYWQASSKRITEKLKEVTETTEQNE